MKKIFLILFLCLTHALSATETNPLVPAHRAPPEKYPRKTFYALGTALEISAAALVICELYPLATLTGICGAAMYCVPHFCHK